MPARSYRSRRRSSSVKRRTTRRPVTKSKAKKLVYKKLGKIVVLTVVFLFSLLLIGSFLVFKKLDQGFVKAEVRDSLNKNYFTLAFVVVDDWNAKPTLINKIEYRLFDLDNKKVYSYNMGQESQIGLDAAGTASEKVSKLFALGTMHEDSGVKDGVNYVNDLIFKYFAFPVDRYVYTDEAHEKYWTGVLANGQFLPLLVEDGLGDISMETYSNMSLSEVYKISNIVAALPDDRLIEKSLSGSGGGDSSFDDSFQQITIDSDFARKAESIAVLNGAGISGTASFGARVIKNLGGRVVAVSNADSRYDQSFVVADEPNNSSAFYLAEVFSVTKVLTKAEAQTVIKDAQLLTSDITVVLGQ
jgi:hypothetical protein